MLFTDDDSKHPCMMFLVERVRNKSVELSFML